MKNKAPPQKEADGKDATSPPAKQNLSPRVIVTYLSVFCQVITFSIRKESLCTRTM